MYGGGVDRGDDAELGAGRRLWVLTTHALVPLLLLWLVSAWIFDSDFIARWMSIYRPSAAESTLALNVSRQMLASEVNLRTGDDNVVGIVGSSSVVNGVDADAISQLWAQQGIPYRAINLGQTVSLR